MIPISERAYFLTVACVAVCLVGLVRTAALTYGVIDHPTHRGSHEVPTPRGGGLGVVLSVVGASLLVREYFGDGWTIGLCLAACSAIAVIGWLDDRGGLPVRTRLVVHLLASFATGLLASSGERSAIVGVALFLSWSFLTVSSINIVNFMDGINGLVASQVAIFATSLMLFGWGDASASWYAAAVTAACVGFLPWNFPRARIFLGDAGSGALGFLVPFLSLLAMRQHDLTVIQAHMPLIPLFGDGVLTIYRRWRRGERLTQAHRSHLYQRLANGGMGHTRVTLLYGTASLMGAIVAHWGNARQSWLAGAAYALVLCAVVVVLERRVASACT